jgi:NADH:ubiquinone oxidoreductase subunit 4 (subunit M)
LHAAYQFFIYTLCGSVFLFIGILLIYFETGSTNYDVLLSYSFDVDFQLKV